jgi:hypothetical protein
MARAKPVRATPPNTAATPTVRDIEEKVDMALVLLLLLLLQGMDGVKAVVDVAFTSLEVHVGRSIEKAVSVC